MPTAEAADAVLQAIRELLDNANLDDGAAKSARSAQQVGRLRILAAILNAGPRSIFDRLAAVPSVPVPYGVTRRHVTTCAAACAATAVLTAATRTSTAATVFRLDLLAPPGA
jgi:hypothetical protein